MFRKKVKFNIAGTFALAVLLLLNLGCQRDDICPEATPTTPQLLISFFDFQEPDIPKTPRNLTVKANNVEVPLIEQGNLSEIRIPLRTDADATEYDFILNASANPEEDQGNLDRVTFTYARDEVYINRACSYKIIYLNLEARLEGSEDPERWIRSIVVAEENIENENNTHIFIYH